MHFGVAALVLVMTLLSFAAFQGIWKFQKLTKNIRDRSIELPLAAELNQKVSELRSVLWDNQELHANKKDFQFPGIDEESIPSSFSGKRDAVEQSLDRYLSRTYQQRHQRHPHRRKLTRIGIRCFLPSIVGQN